MNENSRVACPLAGVSWARGNIVIIGGFALLFMLAFSGVSLLAVYQTFILKNEALPKWMAGLFFLGGLLLLLKVIPACLKSFRSEFVGRYEIRFDDEFLIISDFRNEIRRFRWSQIKAINLGVYFLNCPAIVVYSDSDNGFAFGVALPDELRTEIVHWMANKAKAMSSSPSGTGGKL